MFDATKEFIASFLTVTSWLLVPIILLLIVGTLIDWHLLFVLTGMVLLFVSMRIIADKLTKYVSRNG
ncbi:hypothetical protein D3873_07660 [Paenisporosarcina cavernae]|uniref:Uncharacterized protein n=1 Tax=Paenisporosarcina cavernae TaxID=2320858 RepID=A0A385YSF9_9BACL|nr:hypothetical protein D3873_07660 [Paenisporosarcina cavernae]